MLSKYKYLLYGAKQKNCTALHRRASIVIPRPITDPGKLSERDRRTLEVLDKNFNAELLSPSVGKIPVRLRCSSRLSKAASEALLVKIVRHLREGLFPKIETLVVLYYV
ncbi:MAG: hypothetical protein WAN50_01900 [Minisyncoccia bacterium]